MSRSYKKNMGDTWACGSDKYSRNMYQRSYRRRANRYCQQVKDNYEVEQILIKNCLDLYLIGDILHRMYGNGIMLHFLVKTCGHIISLN